MKKLISIVLVCLLALSISSCSANNESETQTASAQAQTESQSETQAQQTETQSQQMQTKKVSLSVPVMQTSDWSNYQFTEYNGKEEMTVNMSVPSDYSADGTVINDATGAKYAEVIGVVILKDGQSAFDTVKVDSTHNDIKYIDKSSGDVGDGDNTHHYESVVASAPTNDGQNTKYIYYYAIDFGEYVAAISIYSSEKQNGLPEQHKTILSGITVAQ